MARKKKCENDIQFIIQENDYRATAIKEYGMGTAVWSIKVARHKIRKALNGLSFEQIRKKKKKRRFERSVIRRNRGPFKLFHQNNKFQLNDFRSTCSPLKIQMEKHFFLSMNLSNSTLGRALFDFIRDILWLKKKLLELSRIMEIWNSRLEAKISMENRFSNIPRTKNGPRRPKIDFPSKSHARLENFTSSPMKLFFEFYFDQHLQMVSQMISSILLNKIHLNCHRWSHWSSFSFSCPVNIEKYF